MGASRFDHNLHGGGGGGYLDLTKTWRIFTSTFPKVLVENNSTYFFLKL